MLPSCRCRVCVDQHADACACTLRLVSVDGHMSDLWRNTCCSVHLYCTPLNLFVFLLTYCPRLIGLDVSRCRRRFCIDEHADPRSCELRLVWVDGHISDGAYVAIHLFCTPLNLFVFLLTYCPRLIGLDVSRCRRRVCIDEHADPRACELRLVWVDRWMSDTYKNQFLTPRCILFLQN